MTNHRPRENARLFGAIAAGRAELALEALGDGADANALDAWGRSALIRAASGPSPAVVEILLAHGADPRARGQAGHLPIELALDKGRAACLAILARNREMLAEHPFLPLRAAQRGMLDCLRVLVDAGADPSCADCHGRGALHWACARSHAECLEFLLGRGLDPNVSDTQGRSLAYYGALSGSIACLELLAGADLDAPDEHGTTPLMAAVAQKNARCVAHLTARGCALDAQDKLGATAAMSAVLAGSPECLTVLIQCGADLSIKEFQGHDALALALDSDPPQHECARAIRARLEQIALDDEIAPATARSRPARC